MSLLLSSPVSALNLKKPSSGFWTRINNPLPQCLSLSKERRINYNSKLRDGVRACFRYPTDDPILKEALKEPVAFLGGVFAGLLRLDLNEDPLKEWVTRTAEASGITDAELDADGSKEAEEAPQQIEIE